MKWLERIAWLAAGAMFTWYTLHIIHDRGWPLNTASRQKGRITLIIGYDPEARHIAQRLLVASQPSQERWDDQVVITYQDFDAAVEARNRAMKAAWR